MRRPAVLSSWGYSKTKGQVFDRRPNLDRYGRLGHCSDSGLARKTPLILDAPDSDRSSIQAHQWNVVDRQARIDQRCINCRTLFPNDSILIRIHPNRRPVWIAREFGISAYSAVSPVSTPARTIAGLCAIFIRA